MGRWRFALWLLGITAAIGGAMWTATFWEPGGTYKDVVVKIETTRDTCWIIGRGQRQPDGTLDGMYDCGDGGTDLSDDMTLPAPSGVVQKMTDNDAEVRASFVVDGDVTETAVLTELHETVVLSGD